MPLLKHIEYPEIPFGNQSAYKDAWYLINQIFVRHFKNRELEEVLRLGFNIKESFIKLDPYFFKINNKMCCLCIDHCCINRHGFPDFEDLIIRRSLELPLLEYDFSAFDTDTCQFLGEKGCTLKRYERSYRCSWYFCDKVFDYYEKNDQEFFLTLEKELAHIGELRQKILKKFSQFFFK